ncbi:putative starch synthase 4, chloroplastic/amyloplastic, partial [Mucuna pruriens]
MDGPRWLGPNRVVAFIPLVWVGLWVGAVEGNGNFWNDRVKRPSPSSFPPNSSPLHSFYPNPRSQCCTLHTAHSKVCSLASLSLSHHSVPSLTLITPLFHSTIPIHAYSASPSPKFVSRAAWSSIIQTSDFVSKYFVTVGSLFLHETAMRGYDRDEPQDYDDYEDDELEGGEEYEDDGEEEYEEEEPRKPTKEEVKYLELRQKLKESIRKQLKKENSNSLADSTSRKKKLPYDNYGSFFGPSQPVIAQRVIQESKSLLENQHLTPRISNSPHINKSTNKVSSGVLKSSAHNNILPKVSQKKVKAQKLKVTRDYSFLLSDDVDLPAPKKEPASWKTPVHNSEGQPAQVAGKSKQPLFNGGKIVRGSDENRKLVTGAGHLAPKSGSNYKLSSTNKSSKASADSTKQLSSNSGNGPGRLVGLKGLHQKMAVSTMGNKSLTPGRKNSANGLQKPLSSKLHSVNGVQKPLSSKLHSVNVVQKPLSSKLHSVNGVQKPPPSSKLHSSVPKQSVEQRKDLREQNKPKMISKQPVASTKPQINKPLKQIPKHSDLQDHRPKSKVRKRYYDDAEDEMDVSRMIRSMFNYNPNKFVNDDDDDDMEAGFDEIMKEERRSAKIAKKEDEEQLRLIEEEEERQRRRRLSKKRKRFLAFHFPSCLNPFHFLLSLVSGIMEMSVAYMNKKGNKNVDTSLSVSNDDQDMKQDNIWQLFKVAQQNILYLNKQRLGAIEELDKINREKQFLLNRIKKLEAEKQTGAGKDNLSTCSELLLRIDSMVLSSLISPGEASALKSLVMNHRVSVADVFNNTSHKRDPELLGELRHFSDGRKKNGFHIVHICTEMTPLVPRGSVASYVTGISRALQRKGHLVEVILPKYTSLNLDEVQGLREVNAELFSYFNVCGSVVYGIGVTLIEPMYSSFFSREMIYGYPDDFERRGIEKPDKLALCGLDPIRLHRPDRLQDNANTQLVNILKGGVVYSNRVVIMSSIYPKNIIVHNLSHELESTLNVHRDKLVIAPYGLEKSTWDPSTDYFLPKNFNAENINGKAVCKVALLQQLGLSEHSSIILVGCIFSEGRDLDEKKVKVKEVILNTKQHDIQFIFMGTSESSVLNQALESLQKELKDVNLRLVPTYDEALLHLVFAGSDIILCQSFLDPTDEILIALRYGAAPIALSPDASSNRAIPFDRSFINQDNGATNYSKLINSTFGNMSLSLATDEIRTNPAMWKRKIMQAMTHDLSWDGECYDVHVAAYSSIKNM